MVSAHMEPVPKSNNRVYKAFFVNAVTSAIIVGYRVNICYKS